MKPQESIFKGLSSELQPMKRSHTTFSAGHYSGHNLLPTNLRGRQEIFVPLEVLDFIFEIFKITPLSKQSDPRIITLLTRMERFYRRIIPKPFKKRPPKPSETDSGEANPSHNSIQDAPHDVTQPRHLEFGPGSSLFMNERSIEGASTYMSDSQTELLDKGLPALNSDLQDAIKNLNKTIRKHNKRKRRRSDTYDEAGMIEIKVNAGTSPESGRVFEECIESVVTEHRFSQNETIPGKFANYAVKLYPVTRIILGIASLSADAAAFAPVKVVAEGLLQVLSIAMDEHNRVNDILCQLESLGDYGPFLDDLRNLENSSLLQDRANKFLISLANFMRESIEYLDKRGPVKLFNQSWEESKKSLEDDRKRLDDQVLRDMQISLLGRLEQDISKDILSSISGDTSYREKQQQYSSQRMPTIGQWVLDDERFKRWKTENLDGKARVLCCTGLRKLTLISITSRTDTESCVAGAGKTFIASRIVTHLEEFRINEIMRNTSAKIGIAYIYCSVANASQQTTLSFVSSIARQLVELPSSRSNPLRKPAKNFHSKLSTQGQAPDLSDYRNLIREFIGCLDHTFIIIDALDECVEYNEAHDSVRDSFIQTLSCFNARLLFTSRKIGVVDDLEEKAKLLGNPLEGMDISPLPEDVKKYIHWRIYEKSGSKRIVKWIQEGEISESYINDWILKKYSNM
ncbi:hypothetical protein F4805DRAFT_16372 [Annulohypoxylon moriforme]|nr:hypothetical protein F4805DRAFT_16372 [Annulohypoxylon moriforme]